MKFLFFEKFNNRRLEKWRKRGFKFFICYKNDQKDEQLCTKSTKMSRYLNSFKEKTMHVLFYQRLPINCQKNTTKCEIKSAMLWEQNLTTNQCMIKNS